MLVLHKDSLGSIKIIIKNKRTKKKKNTDERYEQIVRNTNKLTAECLFDCQCRKM